MSEVNQEVLNRPFPREAIKQRKGANGISLSYVETHSIIRRLIEATDNQFDFRVMHIDQADDLVMATVELEIPGLGKRQHIGVHRIKGANDEDAVKSSISDAIKKTFSLFSKGYNDLWGPDYEAQPVAHARPMQTQPQPQAQPEPQSSDDYARRQQHGGNGNGQRTRVGFRPLQAAG